MKYLWLNIPGKLLSELREFRNPGKNAKRKHSEI
jgi:hypothetical protein